MHNQCVEFGFPDMNIVDIAAVAFPYDVEEDAVSFYSKHYGAFQDYGDERIPMETPEKIQDKMKDFNRSGESPGALRFQVQCPNGDPRKTKMTTEFSSSLLFHRPVSKLGLDNNVGQLCISNMSREFVKVMFTVIPTETEWVEEDDTLQRLEKSVITKDNHINPIELELKKIIKTGRRVTKEMDTTDGMERRMKRTSEGTQKRLKFFGYLNIFILILTFVFQARYLKTFFQKKKVI